MWLFHSGSFSYVGQQEIVPLRHIFTAGSFVWFRQASCLDILNKTADISIIDDINHQTNFNLVL